MTKQPKTAVHFVDKCLLQPYNPVPVNLIGAGGSGSQMLTALARINYSLNQLDHPGLFVRVFDDDVLTPANQGRQLFCDAEVGLLKSVALINRVNRFFGTNWKAVDGRYNAAVIKENPDYREAVLTIGCVDTVAARFEIAEILHGLKKVMGTHTRHRPRYYMDLGNSQHTGQVLLSTVDEIKQPTSKKFDPTATLPMVTDEFKDLLLGMNKDDSTPSCSHAEALGKQDLFINSSLVNMGASLLWQMFREGMLTNRGFFMNLRDYRTMPVPVRKTGRRGKRSNAALMVVHDDLNLQRGAAA